MGRGRSGRDGHGAEQVGGPVLGWRYYGPIEGRVVGLDRSASDAVRATLEETINRSLPSILENVDKLTATVGKSVELVRSRVDDLSGGVERVRGSLAHLDEGIKDRARGQMSQGLKVFAGLVKRVRAALESVRT